MHQGTNLYIYNVIIAYCFFLEYIFTVKCVFKIVEEFESVSIDI
jgi:hypothetical protein